MSATDLRSRLEILSPPLTSPLQLSYDSFILSLQAARRSPRTIEYYREKLYPFIVWLEAHSISQVSQITPEHIRTFLLEREQAGRSALTIHHHAATIKAWLNFCVSDGIINASPMRKVKMPKLDQRILPAFTPEDVRKLLAAAICPRDTAIILCLLDTGCRRSEFLALNVGDVDLKTGAVRIQQGKGRKDRVAFVGARSRKSLIKYLMARGNPPPTAPLWVTKTPGKTFTDQRMSPNALRLLLKHLGKKAQVAHCHPHTFRRTCALWSLRNGMNIYALQQIMGHSDLTILRRYLALVREDLQEAHSRYGAVDNML